MANRGLFGTIEDTMTSPLWLGGAALLTGEGMGGALQGMRTGAGFQQQRRQQQEEEAIRQRFEGLVNDPQKLQGVNPAVLDLARAAGYRQGFPMLAGAANVDPLKQQLMQAQIDKLRREASGAVPSEYGKTGAVFQGPDGRFYTIQFGSRGERNILPVEVEAPAARPGQDGDPASVPLSPARGITTVDEGTGTRVIDRATGRDVRSIDKNLAEAERLKTEGRAIGELRTSLPKLETQYRMFEDKSERLVNRIDTALGRIGPLTTGPGGLLANLPATEARALRNDLDTIRANIGFEELQAMRDASPTGGALGQVSEMENRLLQAVRGALDQLDRGENLAQNLQIIRDSVLQLRQIKAEQLAQDRAAARAGAFSPPTPLQGGSTGGWRIQRVD